MGLIINFPWNCHCHWKVLGFNKIEKMAYFSHPRIGIHGTQYHLSDLNQDLYLFETAPVSLNRADCFKFRFRQSVNIDEFLLAKKKEGHNEFWQLVFIACFHKQARRLLPTESPSSDFKFPVAPFWSLTTIMIQIKVFVQAANKLIFN